jgi:hypothetical protein
MRRGSVTIDVGADLYLDFGLLKSEGFDAWRAKHPNDLMRNVMTGREHPYYYGGGASVDPRINVAYRGYFAGAKLAGSMFSSFDGADRDQEMMTTKVHFADRDANAEAAAGYERGGVSVMLDGRLHQRHGSAGEVSDTTGERTAMLTIGMRR